jgi:hypothetical protein
MESHKNLYPHIHDLEKLYAAYPLAQTASGIGSR